VEFILIKEGSPEWEYMWNWLGDHPINKELPEPTLAYHQGEGWQYMGSFRQGTKVIHEFRHRNHPVTQRVEDLKVSASQAMNEDCILPKK
jgi:hypothetical protein